MKRVTFLIDGFNLYHSTRSLQKKQGYKCKWLNVKELCKSYLNLFGKEAILKDVFYFSAIPYYLTSTYPERLERHQLYMSCLRDSGVQVELGRFKEKEVFCQNCKSVFIAHEEKETDVAIGVKLMEVCFQDLCEKVVIVSGDTDLSPAVVRCQKLFPEKEIIFAFPFDRKNKELNRLSSNSFSIGKKQYLRYQFPNPYNLSDGTVINKPTNW